ncbi:MAG: glycoside hydrolase family 28 protein [Clostridiales bacterium]|nr:glycoside hydrolase family 28 protein [Clostridiales bacterium]
MMFEVKKLFVSARSVTLELPDGGLYNTRKAYRVFVNGAEWAPATTVVHSIYGLWPDTKYIVKVLDDKAEVGRIVFRTEEETYTLNVRRFGAVGDGKHDDTPAIQAAINCCPKRGRVLIPAGDYHVLPIFLKSHVRIEIQKGATLYLETDRTKFPILPGMTRSTDETSDLNLGSWEGNPLDTFASFISGYQVKDVVIYGEGVLDGQADKADWWLNHRTMRGAWRPRMFFINDCEDVTVQGLSFRNSPAWNLQPYFSRDLKFLNIHVTAPADSPNTDGFDPESCQHILLAGAHFSLGDDCIAIKAGKLYMGATYKTPCSDLEISHCLMENGHGGMTCGSEMAGGVHRVYLHDCLMRNTDRGLRIKTRRGRGEQGVIDDIVFENVLMENVGTPYVVNCLYFCDPDGKTEYVQTREKMPVDERTPRIGRIAFRNVTATDVACAGYFLGLPEKPIERVEMENVSITCGADAAPMAPAMACGVEKVSRKGLVAINVDKVVMKNVMIFGQDGVRLECENVGEVEE